MWIVSIEEDPEDDYVDCVFIVNDETGQMVRQEGLGWYLDELREDEDFDEDELIECYKEEARYLANLWNENPELAPKPKEKT